MKTIPTETVQKVWQTVQQWVPAQVASAMDRMSREQPAVVAYLLAKDEESFKGESRGQLLLLGTLVLEAFRTAGLRCKPVALDEIETAEEQNIRLLEQLDEGSESDWINGVHALLTGYEQTPLLGIVIEILMADDADAPELADDGTGLALLHLKTVIDCLHRRSHASGR